MIKQVAIFFLTTWVLLNAVGIRVFQHTCRESNLVLVSIFEKSETCHGRFQKPSCDKAAHCHKAAERQPRNHSSHKPSCCSSAQQPASHSHPNDSKRPPCCQDNLILYQAPVHQTETFSFLLKVPVFTQKSTVFVILRIPQKLELSKRFYVLTTIYKQKNWLINNILRL